MERLPKLVKAEIDRAIHDNPGALIGLLDLTGVILYVSPNLKDLLGYSPADAIGRNIDEFMSPEQSPLTPLAIQDAALMGEAVSGVRKIKVPSGGYRTMRGPGRVLVDYDTGGQYLLSISRPVDPPS